MPATEMRDWPKGKDERSSGEALALGAVGRALARWLREPAAREGRIVAQWRTARGWIRRLRSAATRVRPALLRWRRHAGHADDGAVRRSAVRPARRARRWGADHLPASRSHAAPPSAGARRPPGQHARMDG